MRPRVDEDDVPYGYCSECGETCQGILMDFGIGPYELWGSKQVHEDWRWVSPCCEAEILEHKPKTEE